MNKQTYWIWGAMISRCTNPNNKFYKNYGAIGISVSERWKVSKNFFEDMGNKPEKMTLERVDNLKGYSKENCIWASRHVQCLNRKVFKNNKFGIPSIEIREKKFRVRIRNHGVLIVNKTLDDFFEACCVRKSYEANYIEKVIKRAA